MGGKKYPFKHLLAHVSRLASKVFSARALAKSVRDSPTPFLKGNAPSKEGRKQPQYFGRQKAGHFYAQLVKFYLQNKQFQMWHSICNNKQMYTNSIYSAKKVYIRSVFKASRLSF